MHQQTRQLLPRYHAINTIIRVETYNPHDTKSIFICFNQPTQTQVPFKEERCRQTYI